MKLRRGSRVGKAARHPATEPAGKKTINKKMFGDKGQS
jgi:hypothetical protein